MKKYYLLSLALLYVGTSAPVKGCDAGGAEEGSLVNKSGKPLYFISSNKGLCLSGQLGDLDKESLCVPMKRLYIWDRDLEAESTATIIAKLKKTAQDSLDKRISEIDFLIKPSRILELSTSFSKTVHIKCKSKKL